MASVKLSAANRDFFQRLTQSAFANPFSDERIASDLLAAGQPVDSNIRLDDAVVCLLDDLQHRVDELERNGAADIRLYPADDAKCLQIGLLFLVFHLNLNDMDRMIVQQAQSPGEIVSAPCTHAMFQRLLGYGITPKDAQLDIGFFFQLRRAFYFIAQQLVGDSACMKRLRMQLWRNIFTHDTQTYINVLYGRLEDFSTLLLGETGTGKGAAAAALGKSGFIPYDAEKRRFSDNFTRAFISVNLSQFSEQLIESELFGHKKGAFTGAVENHDGVFARCSPYGAIFLDEIGEVSEPIQIKLLQVLQEREFSPVGSHNKLRFGGRVIAATNRELSEERREGRLRNDFFYRLCSDRIELPPLRQRIAENPTELELLTSSILSRIAGEQSGPLVAPTVERITNGVGDNYPWPGNVRELEQAVRSVLLTGSYPGDPSLQDNNANGDFPNELANGTFSIEQLGSWYCRRLYNRHKSYGKVAEITQTDWRTVKRLINQA
jgi:Response regulator containing CheY-like receiver, AAA-type ATPase, and DNA-binding domains